MITPEGRTRSPEHGRTEHGRGAAGGRPMWAKHLLVTLHVLTSLGWWATGLAQLWLISTAVTSSGPARLNALVAAQQIDHGLLIFFSNAATYTGVMLAALTPWGFFRHWWVAVKFVATLVAIIVGMGLLGQWRQQMIDAETGAGPAPSTLLAVGGVAATVSVLALLVWVSVAKPWGRIGRAPAPRAARPRVPSSRYLLACLPPLVDYATSLAAGFPVPLLQLATVLGYPAIAARRHRRHDPAG